MIADQLGHAQPTMTMNVYLGRRAADTGAAVLESAALSSESASSLINLTYTLPMPTTPGRHHGATDHR
jgi:hypothetical protein